MSMMMSIYSFSYDSLAKWDRFGLSLPVTRKEVVASKYILSLLFCLIGTALSFLLSSIVLYFKPVKDFGLNGPSDFNCRNCCSRNHFFQSAAAFDLQIRSGKKQNAADCYFCRTYCCRDFTRSTWNFFTFGRFGNLNPENFADHDSCVIFSFFSAFCKDLFIKGNIISIYKLKFHAYGKIYEKTSGYRRS